MTDPSTPASPRRYGGPGGYGHVRDPKGHVVTHVRHLLGAQAPPPAAASLEARVARVLDQGPTSACVGFATAQAIDIARGAFTRGTSALGIYTIARSIDRAPAPDGRLPPLCDAGSQPNQAMRALTEWGAPSEGDWPSDPRTVNREPTLGELEAASSGKIRGTYGLTTPETRVDDLKRALAGGLPVTFAIEVDQAFEDNTGQVIGAPLGAILGAHDLCAIGYDTSPDGSTRVRFVNSWGRTWGDRGFGWGDELFIAGWYDVYAVAIAT